MGSVRVKTPCSNCAWAFSESTGVDRESEALERAEPAFAQVPSFALLLLLFGLALTLNRQGIAVHGDVHVLGLHARQRPFHDELVLGLRDVEWERCESTRLPPHCSVE